MFIFGRFKDPIAWAQRVVGQKETYDTVVNSTIVCGAVLISILVLALYIWIGREDHLAFFLLLVLCFHVALYGIFWPVRYIKAIRALVLDRERLLEALSNLEACSSSGEVKVR